MGNPSQGYGALQDIGYVILSINFSKRLRSVFSGKYYIAHRTSLARVFNLWFMASIFYWTNNPLFPRYEKLILAPVDCRNGGFNEA